MPPCLSPADAEIKCVTLGGEAPPEQKLASGHPPPLRKTARRFTVAEVASHNERGDAWIIYNHLVLDVSKWMAGHPGGEQALLRFAGMDATDELRAFHDDWVLETKLPRFVIGTVDDAPEPTELVRDFRELGERFEELGYYRVSQRFYAKKVAVVFCIFTCAMGLFFLTESFWAHMTSAVLLSLFWQQFAFVGHDLGHMSERVHARDGLNVPWLRALVTFFTGISVAWWNAQHNVHHAVPNTVDCDPDVAHLPVFAHDKLEFDSLFNKFYRRVFKFDWLARNVFVPYQHFWYYPIMCVAKFNFYILSTGFLLSSNDGHRGRNRLDNAAFAGFLAWFSFLASRVPTWGERVAFVMLSHAVAGLLNVQITLSHWPRPVFDSPTKEGGGAKYGGDFYTRGITSTLDVMCPAYLDWFHGGLQFQALHHLYPRLGREHLRKTEPLIASLCKKHSLPYARKSFLECNKEVFRTLKGTALHSRTWSPLIYESMCADG